MTIYELRSEMRRLIGSPTKAQVSNRTIDAYLNNGAVATNRRLGWYFKDAKHNDASPAFALANGTQEYTVPTDLVEPVWFELNSVVLEKTDVDELRNNELKWRSQAAGTPTDWYFFGRKLGLYVKPDATAAAYAWTLRYIATPPLISTISNQDTTGFTDLGTQDHKLIATYAAAEWCVANLGEGGQGKAQNLYQIFDTEAAKVYEQYVRRMMAK